MTHHTNIKLIPAILTDYPTLQNMGRFYTYDLSEYMGWEMPENGLYESMDFKKYLLDETAHTFLIRHDAELAGFIMIDKKGSDNEIDFNMAQFFIIRKFKGKGIAKYVATQCFSQFKGIWEIMIMPGNKGAYQFWQSVIRQYTQGIFTEYTRCNPHLGNTEKNMFRFDSKKFL